MDLLRVPFSTLYDVLWGHPLILVASLHVAAALYRGANIIYLIYFHPLAKFPGPRAAAISQKWIYETSQTGFPEKAFARLHEQYNAKAIRIGPNELHISDPAAHKVIYNQKGDFLKSATFYRAFGGGHSIFVESDYALSKELRQRCNNFFSMATLRKVQYLVTDSLDDLFERLEAGVTKQKSLPIYYLMRCYTVDVITRYTCGISVKALRTSGETARAPILTAFDTATTATWFRAYNPTITWLQSKLPIHYAAKISSKAAAVKQFHDFARQSVETYRAEDKSQVRDPSLLDSFSDFSDAMMADQAMATIGGGTDTTGSTMTCIIYELCRHPTILARLRAEVAPVIEPAFPVDQPYVDIDTILAIPYLTAIIKEGLRLYPAVPGRLPRIVPAANGRTAPLVVDGKVVPAGTRVGMSGTTMHHLEEVWGADTKQFRPERWLEGDTSLMNANLVTFSKGNRNCVGQNLAMAEMHYVLAYLFHRYEVVIDEKGPRELVLHDRFAAGFVNPFHVYLHKREGVKV